MHRKYLKVMSMVYQEGAQYRLNFLLSFLCVIFPLLAMVFLWRTIFRGQALAGFTESTMITYYILVALLNDFVSPAMWMDITNDIRQGTLSNYLLRPINYRWYQFSTQVGTNLGYSLVVLAVVAGFTFLFAVDFHFPDNPLFLLLFLVAAGLSVVLGAGMTYLFSLSAFWLDEGTGLDYVLQYLVPFLMGGLIPLVLLPQWAYQVVSFLPFKYSLYFPVSIFLERLAVSDVARGLLMQVLWIGVVYFLGSWVWRRGCRSYTARGG